MLPARCRKRWNAPSCERARGSSIASTPTDTGAPSSKATRSSKAKPYCCWRSSAATPRKRRTKPPAISSTPKCPAAVGRSIPAGRWISASASKRTMRSSSQATTPSPNRCNEPAPRFAPMAAPTGSTASRAFTWRCWARSPTNIAPPCPPRRCCCHAGFRSISTGSAPGRARSSCRYRSCGPAARRCSSTRSSASMSCSCGRPSTGRHCALRVPRDAPAC